MSELETRNLIYDWNLKGQPQLNVAAATAVQDDTLGSGLLGACTRMPPRPAREQLVRAAAAVGVDVINLWPAVLEPGEGEALISLVRSLGRRPAITVLPGEVSTYRILMTPGLEVRIRRPVSAVALAAEGMSDEEARDELTEAVAAVRDTGADAVWVAEDAARTAPGALASTLHAMADLSRVALVDSAGCATPTGVRRLLAFARNETTVPLDWGGHNDRGLAVMNALVAASHGAARLCGTMLGAGDGAGPVPLDTLLTNLALMDRTGADLVALKAYCQLSSRELEMPIPVNYPVFGADAFRTATGVHAAAIVKARKKGDVWLADRVYSGIPAGLFGLGQVVDIGPMSGISNVSCWLEDRQIAYTQEDVSRILQRAKQSNRTLTEAEVREVLAAR